MDTKTSSKFEKFAALTLTYHQPVTHATCNELNCTCYLIFELFNVAMFAQTELASFVAAAEQESASEVGKGMTTKDKDKAVDYIAISFLAFVQVLSRATALYIGWNVDDECRVYTTIVFMVCDHFCKLFLTANKQSTTTFFMPTLCCDSFNREFVLE